MDALTCSFFTDFNIDPEVKRLKFQHAVGEVRKSFRKNALFPYLPQLIQLRSELNSFLEAFTAFGDSQPKTLTEIDLLRKELRYEPVNTGGPLNETAAFMRTALNDIVALIEEGSVLFDFVEEQLRLQAVGVVPSYVMEGYFLVPDTEEEISHIFRYEISLFTSAEDRYRSLKTAQIRTLEKEEKLKPYNTVKLELIRDHAELPNPAMFAIETSLEIPFAETLLPVSKRMLLRKAG